MLNELISSALPELVRRWILRVPPALRNHGVFQLVAQQTHLHRDYIFDWWHSSSEEVARQHVAKSAGKWQRAYIDIYTRRGTHTKNRHTNVRRHTRTTETNTHVHSNIRKIFARKHVSPYLLVPMEGLFYLRLASYSCLSMRARPDAR